MVASLRAGVSPGNPKLLDRVRDVIRRKHYSFRTEQTYVDWIRHRPAERPIHLTL